MTVAVHLFESGDDEPFAVRMFPGALRAEDLVYFRHDSIEERNALCFRRVSTVVHVAGDTLFNPVPHVNAFLHPLGDKPASD